MAEVDVAIHDLEDHPDIEDSKSKSLSDIINEGDPQNEAPISEGTDHVIMNGVSHELDEVSADKEVVSTGSKHDDEMISVEIAPGGDESTENTTGEITSSEHKIDTISDGNEVVDHAVVNQESDGDKIPSHLESNLAGQDFVPEGMELVEIEDRGLQTTPPPSDPQSETPLKDPVDMVESAGIDDDELTEDQVTEIEEDKFVPEPLDIPEVILEGIEGSKEASEASHPEHSVISEHSEIVDALQSLEEAPKASFDPESESAALEETPKTVSESTQPLDISNIESQSEDAATQEPIQQPEVTEERPKSPTPPEDVGPAAESPTEEAVKAPESENDASLLQSNSIELPKSEAEHDNQSRSEEPESIKLARNTVTFSKESAEEVEASQPSLEIDEGTVSATQEPQSISESVDESAVSFAKEPTPTEPSEKEEVTPSVTENSEVPPSEPSTENVPEHVEEPDLILEVESHTNEPDKSEHSEPSEKPSEDVSLTEVSVSKGKSPTPEVADVKENTPTPEVPDAKEPTPTPEVPAPKEKTPTPERSVVEEVTTTSEVSAQKEKSPSPLKTESESEQAKIEPSVPEDQGPLEVSKHTEETVPSVQEAKLDEAQDVPKAKSPEVDARKSPSPEPIPRRRSPSPVRTVDRPPLPPASVAHYVPSQMSQSWHGGEGDFQRVHSHSAAHAWDGRHIPGDPQADAARYRIQRIAEHTMDMKERLGIGEDQLLHE